MTEVVTSRAKLLAGLLAIVAMMALIVFPSFAYANDHVSVSSNNATLTLATVDGDYPEYVTYYGIVDGGTTVTVTPSNDESVQTVTVGASDSWQLVSFNGGKTDVVLLNEDLISGDTLQLEVGTPYSDGAAAEIGASMATSFDFVTSPVPISISHVAGGIYDATFSNGGNEVLSYIGGTTTFSAACTGYTRIWNGGDAVWQRFVVSDGNSSSGGEHVSGTQSYDSSSDAWTGGTGVVDIVYDTSGGTWQEPGLDPTDDDDNVFHNNGTYIITLPKLISYTGMNIGAVNTSDSYTVNVRGAIESGKKVFVTAETNKTLSADGDAGIVETTTQGKTEWTTDECMGTINTDGSLSGTNSTDTIALSGVAKVAGDYVGYVQYNATVGSATPESAGYGTEVQSWDVGAVENTVFATLYDSGALVVSGQGAMKTFMNGYQPWYSFQSSVTSVVIEDGVTSIGDDAFRGCSSLTSVTIPDSVTSIGGYVFYQCSNLTSVTIPDGVTNIRESVFRDCSSLTSITIPDGVTSIGNNAFQGCSSLTSVTIPDGVTRIGGYAFCACTNLTSVTIPGSVTSIGQYGTFMNCRNLTTINCGFAENAVSGAPWGATNNPTINYNYAG